MAMSQMASTLASPLSFLLLRHSLSPYIPRQHSVSSPLSKHQHSHQILCAKKSSSSNNSKQQKPKAQTASSSLGPKAGVAIYKPKSYEVLAADAANSLAFALQDGKTRLEIDFPPLPSNISSYKGSSDEFIDANIQLALAVVRKLQERMETRACIVFPDKPEKGRASRLFKRALDSIDGITIGSLDDVPTGAVRSFFSSIRNTLDFDFDDQEEGRWQSDEPPTLYVFINCSTRELSVIEKYVVMLKQADSSYACVAESETRFTLSETKEELLRVLGLQEEEGSSLQFLRRGYKNATWWEEDVDLELSSAWRS